ncbi:hypothetical protein BJ742DRAFT_832003 [Cladochytrium replicatum]|nr:hypothetical protein BJ742DRAFT_832003 [Cladochytrium replicatum]
MKAALIAFMAIGSVVVNAQGYGSDPAPTPSSSSTTPGQYCNADKSFCVSAIVSGANVTVTYGCKATGWCAFGIGAAMANADIVVGWNNGASFVISDRTSTGHSLPPFDSVQAISAVAAPAALDASHTIKISYTRPVAATGPDKAFPSGSASFIYAMSNNAPATPANANSAFTQHNGGHAGFTATLVVAQQGGSAPSSTSSARGSAKVVAAVFAVIVLFAGLILVV